MCAGRDASHGAEHMHRVARTAKKIGQELNLGTEILDACEWVAELHDVADHKYDKDGSLSEAVADFVQENRPTDYVMILKTIEYISFSKEKKKGKRYFEQILGPEWTLVRDIVSDADKLEALGTIGIERCHKYTSETHPGASEEEIIRIMHEHAEDKLYKLATEYIMTAPGREMALPLHDEMKAWFIAHGHTG